MFPQYLVFLGTNYFWTDFSVWANSPCILFRGRLSRWSLQKHMVQLTDIPLAVHSVCKTPFIKHSFSILRFSWSAGDDKHLPPATQSNVTNSEIKSSSCSTCLQSGKIRRMIISYTCVLKIWEDSFTSWETLRFVHEQTKMFF